MSDFAFKEFSLLPPELQDRILNYRVSQGSPVYLDKYTNELISQQSLKTLCNNIPSYAEIQNYLNTFPLSFTAINSTPTSLMITVFQEQTSSTNLPVYRFGQHKLEHISAENQEEYVVYGHTQSQMNYDPGAFSSINVVDLWSMYNIFTRRANCVGTFNAYAKTAVKNYLMSIYASEFNSSSAFRLIGLYLYLYLNLYIWHFNTYHALPTHSFHLASGDVFDIDPTTKQVYTNVDIYNSIISDIPLLYQQLMGEISS